MRAGFTERTKNNSFSLFLQKFLIKPICLCSSDTKFSMGRKSPFRPLASMWAKYFPSFERRATDSFELRLKFFIIAKINNSSREFDYVISFWGLSFDKSTSAEINKDDTVFLGFFVVVFEFAYDMENYIMIPIDNFCLVLLAHTNIYLFQLVSTYHRAYMRKFQLLTRLTADAEERSYSLYPSTIACII